MSVDFSDEWNSTVVLKSLLEVINIQFATWASHSPCKWAVQIHPLWWEIGRAEHTIWVLWETGQKGSASGVSFPRKTSPSKSGALLPLQPPTALKVVQVTFPLLTISHQEHIFLGALLTFGIFSCSLAIVFASSLFSYRESWNDLQLKYFFNGFLLLLRQNRFWTVDQCSAVYSLSYSFPLLPRNPGQFGSDPNWCKEG